MSLQLVAFLAATWVGTAQVDVLILEQGGEHPYHTRFELVYDERTSETGGFRLVPKRIRIRVEHEVRGLLNCKGTGEETLVGEPTGEIAPGGIYELILPRAIGAFACGTNVKNRRDRRVAIGQGLFNPDAEVEDPSIRRVMNGSRLFGAYEHKQSRQYASEQDLVKYDFHISWDLHRAH